MHKNEILVFMQYDSDWRSAARYTFHTAITDPTVNDMKEVPPRESIEARLIAFFPDFEPNTIPQIGIKEPIFSEEEVIKKAIKGIHDSIKAPGL